MRRCIAWHQGSTIPTRRTPHGRSRVPRLAACLLIVSIAFLLGTRPASGNAQGNAEPPSLDPTLQEIIVTGSRPSLDLTLQDSILLVLQNNRALVNARLSREFEKFSLQVAENKFRPHVTIGPYSNWRSTEEPFTDISTVGVASRVGLRVPTGGEFALGLRVAEERRNTPSPSSYPNALALTFIQPLLRGAGFDVSTASVRIARLVEEINILALKATVMDIISAVVRSYRSYIQAERRVDINARSLKRAQELLAVNELLVQAGRMAERDVVQTQADIARRELNLIAARNRLDAARLALIDILDIDSRTQLRLTDSLDIHPVPIDMARVIELAFQRRPDYLGSVLGVSNAETREMVARNRRLWDLSLIFSTNLARTDETFGGALSLDTVDYTAALDLSIPLGRAAADPRKLEHLEALTVLKRARNSHEDLRQRIEIEVRNAVREVEISLRQVDLSRTARQLMEQKTNIEREKLSLGLSTNFQLVTFEEDLVAAQNSELDATVAYLNARTVLDRTSGVTLDTWDVDIERVEAGAFSK